MSGGADPDDVRAHVEHAARVSRFLPDALMAAPPLLTAGIALGVAVADDVALFGIMALLLGALGAWSLATALSCVHLRGGSEALEWMSQRFRRDHLRRLGIDPDRPLAGDPQAVPSPDPPHDREDP